MTPLDLNPEAHLRLWFTAATVGALAGIAGFVWVAHLAVSMGVMT